MKKILLFARDPGGANTIMPLIEPLKDRGYEVLVFGKDVALIRFAANNIEAKDITKEMGGINEVNISNFIKVKRPNFIITGTSADDMTEKYLWKEAEKLKIPSFAIIDQWLNYGIRFSRYGVDKMEEYLKRKEFDYLPTKILIMDDLAKKEAIEEGLPAERIIVSGQPYFEYLKNKKFDQKVLQKIKTKNNIKSGEYIIVYASEPIRKTYGESSTTDHFWGYDEISVFKCLYKAMLIASEKFNKKIKLIIKPHPKEDLDHYNELIFSLKKGSITIKLDKESDSQYLIKLADLVCGMSSMFLLESYLLGKATISVQIGLNKKNPFVLDRIGIVKSILNQQELNSKISSLLSGGKTDLKKFKLINNPVERVIVNMERVLCQN
jgi:hypothetical protein